MGPIRTLDDLIDMVRRRAMVIITVSLLGCIVSIFWALSLPSVYRSSQVIQIELPYITNHLAPPTVDGSAVRRLQLIEQRLVARTNLINLIEEYDLYADLAELSMIEKAALLRSSVTIRAVQAPFEGDSNGLQISSLTFTAEMDNPAHAQAIAQEFSDRTLALAAAQRREQSRETLEFFQRQERNLIRDIDALEAERVAFRNLHDLSLPGGLEGRRSEISSLNDAISDLDREIIATRLARNTLNLNARATTLTRQRSELDAAFESLTTQRNRLIDQRDALNSSLQTTPEIDRELAQFERRLEQLQSQLEVTTARRNEAEVGFSLEAEERGEKLIVLEKAELPEHAAPSGRKERAAVGGLTSLVLALAIAYLLELRRPVLRSADQMARETGLTPIISIPDLSPREKRPSWGKVWQERLKRIIGVSS